MSSLGNQTKLETYSSIKESLLARAGPVLPPSPSSPSQQLAHAISSLLVHPSIEAALHILNDGLPSAHFLVRHMQAAPQYESMYLHGILHRIEGDYDNARAWYRDVKDSEVFREVWGSAGLEDAMAFLRKIEILRRETKAADRKDVDVKNLENESMREIRTVLEFCERSFGTEKVEDASKFWVQDEKSSGQASDMVVGGEGWRQF